MNMYREIMDFLEQTDNHAFNLIFKAARDKDNYKLQNPSGTIYGKVGSMNITVDPEMSDDVAYLKEGQIQIYYGGVWRDILSLRTTDLVQVLSYMVE